MTEVLRFTVSTFRNVFDTTPHHEQVTLQQLTRTLRRYQIKPDLQSRIEREMRRIDSVYRAWKGGEVMSGKRIQRLRDVEREAESAGEDVDTAVFEAYQQLKAEARREAKRELRLWSPAIFREGGRRTSDDVTHVSCLVLDYDDNTRIEEAIDAWQPWFHIVHTTWSHQHSAHRFRVVLPLTEPVAVSQWATLWRWAEARAERRIDPACKGTSRSYALPVTPSPRADRIAFTHAGALLNPALEGIVASAPAPRLPAPLLHDDGFTFVHGDPEATYVEQRDDPSRYGAQPDDPDADDIWDGGAQGVDRFDAANLWDGGAPDVPLRSGQSPAAANQPWSPEPAPELEPEPDHVVAQGQHASHLAFLVDDDPDSGEVPVVDAASAPSRRAPGTVTLTLLEQLVDRLDRLLGQLLEPALAHGIDIDALERLAELHENGVLTRNEFRMGKQRILAAMAMTATEAAG